jgi:hypothetical protein
MTLMQLVKNYFHLQNAIVLTISSGFLDRISSFADFFGPES